MRISFIALILSFILAFQLSAQDFKSIHQTEWENYKKHNLHMKRDNKNEMVIKYCDY